MSAFSKKLTGLRGTLYSLVNTKRTLKKDSQYCTSSVVIMKFYIQKKVLLNTHQNTYIYVSNRCLLQNTTSGKLRHLKIIRFGPTRSFWLESLISSQYILTKTIEKILEGNDFLIFL